MSAGRSPAARFVRFALLFVVFAVVTGAAFPVIAQLAIWIVPNRTSDGHVVMPMGQAAFALLMAPVMGLTAAIAVGKKLPRRS